ncbi:hypothetical protein IFM89_018689 [Coptis chinensis]|uniref:Uncharacterized protein n=1 Tax=Coptis chinensis TaxID=261450 RepID=A0A835LZV8_9MAGN|nr:hypothetical protein IFM89_018689 [Coptis chinensis]
MKKKPMAPYSYSVDSEMTNEMSISTVEPILFGVRTSIDDHVSQDPINIEGVELDLLSFDYFDGSTNAWDMPSENVNPSEQNEVDLTEQFTTDLASHFSRVRGFVSKDAMEMILEERKCGGLGGMATKECGCVLRRTHGLPCACDRSNWL